MHFYTWMYLFLLFRGTEMLVVYQEVWTRPTVLANSDCEH